MIIYRLFVRMKEADMLNGYSVKDCLFFLSGIRKQQRGKLRGEKLGDYFDDQENLKILSLLRCNILIDSGI